MRTAKQMALGVGSVGVVAASVSFFFVMPNYREARAVQMQVADLQARVNTLESRKRAVDRLEEDVRIAREVAANNLKTIPETADVAGLIRRLSDRIDGVNVVDQTFTAGTPGPAIIIGGSKQEDPGVQALPVAADMHATFETVMALIDKAEAMSRLVRVSSVRLMCKRDDKTQGEGGGEAGGVPLLQASVGLEVIYDATPGGKTAGQ